MKIQFASDLHIEFAENRDYIDNGGIEPVGEMYKGGYWPCSSSQMTFNASFTLSSFSWAFFMNVINSLNCSCVGVMFYFFVNLQSYYHR